jgi:hypothetical protein
MVFNISRLLFLRREPFTVEGRSGPRRSFDMRAADANVANLSMIEPLLSSARQRPFDDS